MSLISGQLIARTGKYKIFPIIGCSVMLVSLLLMQTVEADTAYWQIAIFAYLMGAGMGLSIMTVMAPIQNAVEMRDMGVATSTTTFGRSLGGAIGAALFGAVLTTRLAHYLSDELAGTSFAATAGGEIDTNSVQAIRALEEPLRSEVLKAYTHAITDIFLYAIPFIVIGLVIILFLKEIPLRTSQRSASDEEHTDAGMPAMSGH
jgi:MFS family permease